MTATAEAPVEMIPATDVARAIGAITEAHARALEAQRIDLRKQGEQRASVALEDQRRQMLADSRRAYERGGHEVARLRSDEYRDTFAVLAEVRTRTFAARLDFDDAEGVFTITALVSKHTEMTPRKLVKEILTQQAAWDFYNRVVDKFYSTQGFICRVDY